VLDHVEVLLNNYDAETAVISADHGEAFGKYGIYKHPYGVPHPHVKYVPWCETKGQDTGEYVTKYPEPDLNRVTSEDTEELLKTLGYL